MKKDRYFFAAAAMLLCAILTGCAMRSDSARNHGNAEIDAISVSMKEAETDYLIKTPEYKEELWISRFDIKDGTAYYIGNFMDRYELCRVDIQGGTKEGLRSFDAGDTALLDLAVYGGDILLLTNQSMNNDAEFKSCILSLDQNGNLLSEYDLSQLNMPDGWFPYYIEASDSAVYLLGGGYLCAVKLDEQASLLYSLETVGTAAMTMLPDGTLIIGQNETDAYTLKTLDEKARSWGSVKSFNLPFSQISSGITWDLYLDDGSNLYGYNLNTDLFEKLAAWNKLGVAGGKVAELEDGSLLCCVRNGLNGPMPLLRLEKGSGAVFDREPSSIVIATANQEGLRIDIKEAIWKWNQERPDCPIEVRDYSVYYNGNDERAAELKLAADIASGNIPDIYDLSGSWRGMNLSFGQLMRRGMLENLYPYIDRDGELSRDIFFSGVLESLEMGNGLYELVVSYQVLTSYALAQDVGAENDWTYDNFNSVVTASDYYKTLFTTHNSRLEWLMTAVAASGSKLVDWEKSRCSFNSDYFINILQTAKNLPADAENIQDSYVIFEDIKNGTGLLYLTNMQSIWNVSSAATVYGENAAFVGLPEIGNVIWPEASFGVSSYSLCKDECWQFLRQFIIGSNVEDTPLEFSMRRDVEEAHLAFEMKMAKERGYIEHHPHVESTMYKLLDVLENAKSVFRHDPQIWEIVQSEVGAYFAGDKSAEQTAESIQSRVSIYMAEQS